MELFFNILMTLLLCGFILAIVMSRVTGKGISFVLGAWYVSLSDDEKSKYDIKKMVNIYSCGNISALMLILISVWVRYFGVAWLSQFFNLAGMVFLIVTAVCVNRLKKTVIRRA